MARRNRDQCALHLCGRLNREPDRQKIGETRERIELVSTRAVE